MIAALPRRLGSEWLVEMAGSLATQDQEPGACERQRPDWHADVTISTEASCGCWQIAPVIARVAGKLHQWVLQVQVQEKASDWLSLATPQDLPGHLTGLTMRGRAASCWTYKVGSEVRQPIPSQKDPVGDKHVLHGPF